jgi:hypothetical protein
VRCSLTLLTASPSSCGWSHSKAVQIEELVEPQHVLARRTRFPLSHGVLGLNQVWQPILTFTEHLVEQGRQGVGIGALPVVFGSYEPLSQPNFTIPSHTSLPVSSNIVVLLFSNDVLPI